MSTASQKGCGGLSDFEVTVPCRHLRCSSVYVSVGEKPDKPACPPRARWKLVLGSDIPMQDITISQCSPSCLWNSTCPSGAGCSPWHFTQGDHKGLLCQQRTKCCQCSLVKSKKEGMASATLSLGYICLFSLGSWDERWQKSKKDIPQFLSPTLNAQSLNFSWSIDSWCEGMSVFPSGVTGGTLTWSF